VLSQHVLKHLQALNKKKTQKANKTPSVSTVTLNVSGLTYTMKSILRVPIKLHVRNRWWPNLEFADL
jgi:hypothetical protein